MALAAGAADVRQLAKRILTRMDMALRGEDTSMAFDDDAYNAISETFYAEAVRPSAGGADSNVVPEWAIDSATGQYLYDLTKRVRPRLSIEVGLCQAASALHFTAAHAANGSGLHIAIDPFQLDYFQDQGVLTIDRMGLSSWFTLLRERSDRVLPMLQAAGLKADILFIDGDHRFDAVFTDYYFADKLLPVGSYLIFDEGGYECPTQRVASFLTTNMSNYERLDSPVRLYVFKKRSEDTRSFADDNPF